MGAESFDPGSTLALSHLAVTDPLGVGSGQIDITVPSGFSTMLLVVTAPGAPSAPYRLNVTHDVDPSDVQRRGTTVKIAHRSDARSAGFPRTNGSSRLS